MRRRRMPSAPTWRRKLTGAVWREAGGTGKLTNSMPPVADDLLG